MEIGLFTTAFVAHGRALSMSGGGEGGGGGGEGGEVSLRVLQKKKQEQDYEGFHVCLEKKKTGTWVFHLLRAGKSYVRESCYRWPQSQQRLFFINFFILVPRFV